MARSALEAVMVGKGPIDVEVVENGGQNTAVLQRNSDTFTGTTCEGIIVLKDRLAFATRARRVFRAVGVVGLAGGAALVTEGALLGGGFADAAAGVAVAGITLPAAVRNARAWALEQDFVQEAMDDLRSGLKALRTSRVRDLPATLAPQG